MILIWHPNTRRAEKCNLLKYLANLNKHVGDVTAKKRRAICQCCIRNSESQCAQWSTTKFGAFAALLDLD